MKRLASKEGPLQILLINNAIGLTISTLAVLWFWKLPTTEQWIGLAALGFLMAMAQTCYVNAVARADSSLVVPFSYATLVFVTLYDFLIFSDVPDAISLIGAAIIIFGAALLGFREAKQLKSKAE